MDILLERMLSLIPKKSDGSYVHGGKKQFCEKIGAPTNIVSEWEAGKTRSYRNYVYAVASNYNVSVEWLRGETDEKEPPAQGGELSEKNIRLVNWFRSLPPEKQKAILIAQDGPIDAAD